jgi:hypothetical protein
MTRFLLAAALAALTATAASAAERRAKLPADMLGTWCFDMHTTETSKRYVRGQDCEHGSVVIGPDGYETRSGEGDDDTSCKTILSSVAVDRKYNNVYSVRYRCWGYRGLSRQKTTHSWIETKRIWLGKGDTVLVMDETK